MIASKIFLLPLLILMFALAGCGDDESEPADTGEVSATETTTTAPTTTTTEAPATTTTETTAEEPPSDDPKAEISQADAAQEAARQAGIAAEEVPESDLYFADSEDVDCTAPGADPTNPNSLASEWACTVDSDTNGIHCTGTVTVYGDPGANPGLIHEGISVRDVAIACEPS